MSLKFPKGEKLKSRKLIDRLFSEGKSATEFPIKLLYLTTEEVATNQAAFAVPKKNFKLAVDRNRIKRQMREAFRLNKSVLNTNKTANYALLFLYIGRDPADYERMSSAIASLLKILQK